MAIRIYLFADRSVRRNSGFPVERWVIDILSPRCGRAACRVSRVRWVYFRWGLFMIGVFVKGNIISGAIIHYNIGMFILEFVSSERRNVHNGCSCVDGRAN